MQIEFMNHAITRQLSETLATLHSLFVRMRDLADKPQEWKALAWNGKSFVWSQQGESESDLVERSGVSSIEHLAMSDALPMNTAAHAAAMANLLYGTMTTILNTYGRITRCPIEGKGGARQTHLENLKLRIANAQTSLPALARRVEEIDALASKEAQGTN